MRPSVQPRSRRSQVTLASEMQPAEVRALQEIARRAPASGAFLEIGTAAGGTLVQLLAGLGPGHGRRVVVVDPMRYFPGQRAVWEGNLRAHGIDPGTVELFVGTSARALRRAPGLGAGGVAFALIDGGHKLKDVIRDTRWLARLATGGIAAFHDYAAKFPGVRCVVDLFLRRNRNYRVLHMERTLLFLERTGPGRAREMPWWLIALLTAESVLGQWGRGIAKRFPGGRPSGG